MTFILTIFATTITGVIIFIFSQVFLVLFLERIRTQARCVEDIAQALVVYANVFTSPVDDNETDDWKNHRSQGASELRRLSALLGSTSQTLRLYSLWEGLGFVVSQKDILEASRSLIFLSNNCFVSSDRDPEFSHTRLMAAVSRQADIEKRLKLATEPEGG